MKHLRRVNFVLLQNGSRFSSFTPQLSKGLVALCALPLALAVSPAANAQTPCGPGQPASGCRSVAVAEAIPSEPMVLTRTMTRELAGGEALSVRRSWQLSFVPKPWGYLVTGNRIGVEVDAPPQLGYLAEIEQSRGDDKVITLKLDNSGMIVDMPSEEQGADQPKSAATNASKQAIKTLENRGVPQSQAARAASHLRSIVQLASKQGASLPADFFFPQQLEWHTDIGADTENPAAAMTQVHFTAELAHKGGLLHRSRREVSTRLGGSERKTVESWELEAADRD